MPERKEGFWPERSEGLKTASAHGRINSLPEWRNRQTRWTQNPVGLTAREGSIPFSGRTVFRRSPGRGAGRSEKNHRED